MKDWTPETIAEARSHKSFERTGWRDAALSARHHDYGFDLPMVDIDFLVVAYCYAKPTAMIEYKNERAQTPDFNHPSYRVLKHLAAAGRLPLFICRYATDFSWWIANPLNYKAHEFLARETKFDEEGWVEFLYLIRGLPMPQEVRDLLSK